MNFILKILKFFFHDQIRQFHIFAFFKNSSFKKFKNFLLNEYERRTRKIVLKSMPYTLYLEATNKCNYQCPFCFTGQKLSSQLGAIALSEMERILNQFKDYVYFVTFHGLGEPLLHKDIDSIIKLAHERKIFTVMSTNVSLLREEVAKKLVNSKLDYLILSIDGATKESYNKYQFGGKFDDIIQNVKTMVKVKKEMKSETPYIEWQFVVFQHNYHEIDQAKKMAKEIGVDGIKFFPGIVEDESYAIHTPDFEVRNHPLKKRKDCKALWSTAMMTWNGNIAACCWDDYADSGFGNILQQDFKEIWNNKKFQDSRRVIKDGINKAFADTICYLCVKYINQKAPALVERELKQNKKV